MRRTFGQAIGPEKSVDKAEETIIQTLPPTLWDPLDPKQQRSPRNRRVSIVLLRGENVKKDEFDRVPNFLEKVGPKAVVPNSGETLAPAKN